MVKRFLLPKLGHKEPESFIKIYKTLLLVKKVLLLIMGMLLKICSCVRIMLRRAFMRILLICFIFISLSACSMPTPTPIRGVTVVPLSPVPDETDLAPNPSQSIRVENCPDAPPIRLIVQERGRSTSDTTDPINLRNGPGREYNVITSIETGEIFFVLDGPSCNDTFAWFYVRYRRNGHEYLGWIAEGDADNYYVEPYLQG
jgi:hypothetical protein